MDIWYQCDYCEREYPVHKLVKYWEDAPQTLPDTCQWCNKGTYVKIKK